MRRSRGWLIRFGGLFNKQRLDCELDAEMASHLEMHIEDNLRTGMTPEEARRQALLKLGGVEQTKENYRDRRGLRWLESVLQDVRFSLRMLRKSPGFTAVAVMTLALGIGVNAAVFTIMNATLFKGFPLVKGNDRILYITTTPYCCVSYADFEDWRAQAKSFEGMALARGVGMTFSDQSGFPELLTVTEVSSETFKLVGQRPIIGRDFAPSDETPGTAPVAILSYGFWERQYGKDPAILGRAVRLNGAPTTVVGVMPREFFFPQNQDLWIPLVPTPDDRRRENRATWFAFGRMAEGVTVDSARAEIGTIGKQLESSYPITNKGFPPEVRNFREFFIGSNATLIYEAMWGAVGFVLLIACANLANLMLTRANGRSREISIRIALGAGRWRIIRQLLIESVMLSALGGVLGWWIAKCSVRSYELAPFSSFPSGRIDYTTDYHVFAYLIAISIGTGLLFGLAPASKLSKFDVNATLKDGGHGTTDGERGRHLSALLVIGEMALAVLLLAGAGVMVRSFINIYSADVGVRTTDVLTMSLNLPDAKYVGAEAQISFYDSLRARLEAIPGVESIAIANSLPTGFSLPLPYQLTDAPPVQEQRRPRVPVLVVSPAYFRVLGAVVLAGREFNDTDGASGVPVAIVNERFANEYWPGEDPLGKRLRLYKGKVALLGGGNSAVTSQTPEAWLAVVGVVSNIVQNDATRQEFSPLVYLPYREKPAAAIWVLARTRISPGSLGTAFRREIQALDPDLPIFDLVTLNERLERGYVLNRNIAALFLIFAAIALLLASVGLYAVIAYSVSQRTQEIGIRMALGATPGHIRKIVFRQGMLPVGIGLLIGLVASLAVNRLLKAELVQISPNDPLTLVVACVALILAAMLGCLIPARRAMRVDPAVALRYE